MSGYGIDEPPVARRKDPIVRMLVGCAIVIGACAAIAVGVGLLIGWRLVRDEAPGKPVETFLVGDESRYWCVDLKPGDAGLLALFARFEELNDATRRDLFRGTFLEGIPLPRRRARLSDLAPLTLELSLSVSDEAKGLQQPAGWAARGTFSHYLFKMRAALKLMRFMASRDPEKSATIDVDGIAVTEVRGNEAGFALATVGNRVLVASDASRVRKVLRSAAEPTDPRRPKRLALHEELAGDGEDAWAFLSGMRLGGLSRPLALDGAVASFDVNDRDELAFRIIVMDEAPVEEGSAFQGSREDCVAVASAFLPGVPIDAIEIEGNGATRREASGMEFRGRIAGLSKRLAELVRHASAFRPRQRPSANPTPPSPPGPAGPQTGTPAEPTREGTPTPPR